MARTSGVGWVVGALGVGGLLLLVANDAAAEPSSPTHSSIAERAVLWSLAQQALGPIETEGHNAGPLIAAYHSGAMRRDDKGQEKPLGITSGNWCASGLSYAERQVLLPGEQPVLPWRASGVELLRDAEERGRWRPVAAVRAGVWLPRRGDVAIFVRPAAADPKLEWRRHVGRVSRAPDTAGRYQTIDANHGEQWGVRERKLTDGALLGFVQYPD